MAYEISERISKGNYAKIFGGRRSLGHSALLCVRLLSNLIFVTEIQESTKVYFPDCYETRLFKQTLAIRNRAPIDTRVRNRGEIRKIPFEFESP